MLHVVKRNFARAQQPIKSAPNAEFADLKQRLSSIKASLKYTSNMLTNANRHWIIQMQQQRQFSERFHESYPTTTDDTYVVATKFADGSQALYDKFTREAPDDVTAYHDIHKQVLIYIGEIERVEATYSKLAIAKSEAARYQSKLDSMERSRRQTDESKKARNLQKMDNEKDMYKKLLAETIMAQKETYAKHPIVFKAALTSYWLSHEKHVTSLVQSLEQTQEFAKKAEEEMRNLDIATWSPPKDPVLQHPVPSSPRDLEDNKYENCEVHNDHESFHSASTIPIDIQTGPNVYSVESPTNVINTFATEPLINRKDGEKKSLSENASGAQLAA